MKGSARFVERHAALVALAWIVAAVWMTLAAPSVRDLGTADQTAFVPASAPSGQADALLRSAFPDDPTRDPAVIVIARAGGLQETDRQYVASLARFLAGPEARTHVKAVQTAATSPELAPLLRSPDGAAELVIVSLKAQVFSVSSERAVSFLREHLESNAPPGLQTSVTGLAALAADQAAATIEAFDKTAVATVLLVLLILVLVYRSVVAPLISLLTIGSAFLVARGSAGYLAEAGLQVHSLAETFMIVMAFGAGTDYVMFVLSRYREEVRREASVPSGETGRAGGSRLVAATTAVSPTVVASGATVILGFLAFLAAELGLLRSFGPVLGVAIAVTVLASLTFTPALMRLAGPALFWPSRQGAAGRLDGSAQRWGRVAALIGRRPLAVLLISVAALALPAAAATQTKISFDIPAELPADAGARQGFDLLAAHYPPGVLAPAFVVVSAQESLLDGDRLATVDRLTDRLRAIPGVAQVRSVTQPAGQPLTKETLAQFTGGETDLRALGIDPDRTDVGPLIAALSSPDGLRLTGDLLRDYPTLADRLGYFLGDQDRTTRIVVAFDSSPYAASVLEEVGNLDDIAAGVLAQGDLGGTRVAVGGPSAYFSDIQTLATGDLRTVGALVLATIMLVLAALVRSVIAPLYLLASVVLSMLAALGITTLVFQGLLGEPGLAFYLPILLFVMLIALGSDYNIFIVGRIREEIDAGRTVREATTRALVSTGPTITAAGFVLAGTFGALLITPLPSVRQIGFGVAVGILIDTFLVRTLLVPAITILLGRYAFWPSTGLTAAGPGARPRLAVAAAGAGLLVAAIALPTLAFAVRDDLAVVQVPAKSAVTAGAVAQPTAAGPTTPAPDAPSPSSGTRPATRPSTAPPAPSAVPEMPEKPTKPTKDRSPAPKATPKPDEASRAASAVTPPAEGRWTYRVEGTRTVGAAGTAQPFAEDADSVVTRTGGTQSSPQFRIATATSFATTDETRRYGSTSVDALSIRVSTLGLNYGGTFDTPQELVRIPLRVGESWTSRWRAEGTRGVTTSTVTGTRTVTVENRRQRCYVIERTTTLEGDVNGTQRQRTCWIPALGMPATDRQELRGTYQGIKFDATASMTLLSTPPDSDSARMNSDVARGTTAPARIGHRRTAIPKSDPLARTASPRRRLAVASGAAAGPVPRRSGSRERHRP